MRLPFLQMESDLIAHGAPQVAALAGCPTAQALGHIAILRAWAVAQGGDDAPPDGWAHGDDAAEAIEAAAQWGGEPGRFLRALKVAKLVNVSADGVQVLGLEPYRLAWEKNAKAKERMANARARSANVRGTSDEQARNDDACSAKFGGQMQMQTEKQNEQHPASQATGVADAGEELTDAPADAVGVSERPALVLAPCPLDEVQEKPAPRPRKPRTPSPGVALYERMEAARAERWREHVAAHPEAFPDAVADPENGWRKSFVPEGVPPARQEGLFGDMARRDEAGKERLILAFAEYLADPAGLTRTPPWSLRWFVHCIATYETRVAVPGRAGGIS